MILEELADTPLIQFAYLKKFLKQNEFKIQQAITDSVMSTDRRLES